MTTPLPNTVKAAFVASGDRIRAVLGGPVYDVTMAIPARHNGQKVIMLDVVEHLDHGTDRSQVFLGPGHTCWKVEA